MKTKLEAQHTSTPWYFNKLMGTIEGTDFDGVRIRLVDIPDHEAKSQQIDAEFIVRAVNSHESLLETLKKAREFVANSDNYNDGGEPANRLMCEITVAIAQAEGRP